VIRVALTRRSLLVLAGSAATAPVLLRLVGERGFDGERRVAYEALCEALLVARALPDRTGASGAADRLADVYADALPARRREIDLVLDALIAARLAHRHAAERLQVLREWAAAGGERRATAARALDLAGAAFGPADRPLPVVV
jgi:hypothetical protein